MRQIFQGLANEGNRLLESTLKTASQALALLRSGALLTVPLVSRTGLYLQAAIVFGCVAAGQCLPAFGFPIYPGYAIGALALVAAVMTVRSDMKWPEKMLWALMSSALFIVELRVVADDRFQQDGVHRTEMQQQQDRFAVTLEEFRATKKDDQDILNKTKRNLLQTSRVLETSQRLAFPLGTITSLKVTVELPADSVYVRPYRERLKRDHLYNAPKNRGDPAFPDATDERELSRLAYINDVAIEFYKLNHLGNASAVLCAGGSNADAKLNGVYTGVFDLIDPKLFIEDTVTNIQIYENDRAFNSRLDLLGTELHLVLGGDLGSEFHEQDMERLAVTLSVEYADKSRDYFKDFHLCYDWRHEVRYEFCMNVTKDNFSVYPLSYHSK